MRKILASLLVVGLLTGVATAVPSISWNNAATVDILGTSYDTWEMLITTGTGFGAAQILLNAAAPGDIYQNALGGPSGTPQNPLFFGTDPNIEYDSYITTPALHPDELGVATEYPALWPIPLGTQTIANLANVLGISPIPGIQDTADKVVVGWSISDGARDAGPGTWTIQQLTLKTGAAMPTYDLMVWELDPNNEGANLLTLLDQTLPEPATLMVLALGAVAGLIRRRR